MATAAELTEAHRLGQLAIGAATVAQLRAVFRLLDPADLDASFADWLTVVLPLIAAARARSTSLAAAYLTTVRAGELGEVDDFAAVLAPAVAEQQLVTSMLVTGPVSLRANLARAMPVAQALDIAEARTAAAGMRHALNGGRETVTATVRADQRARGWQRITSGKGCHFCRMLASRGAVYRESTVGFQAHDGCACAAQPLYG